MAKEGSKWNEFLIQSIEKSILAGKCPKNLFIYCNRRSISWFAAATTTADDKIDSIQFHVMVLAYAQLSALSNFVNLLWQMVATANTFFLCKFKHKLLTIFFWRCCRLRIYKVQLCSGKKRWHSLSSSTVRIYGSSRYMYMQLIYYLCVSVRSTATTTTSPFRFMCVKSYARSINTIECNCFSGAMPTTCFHCSSSACLNLCISFFFFFFFSSSMKHL